MLDLKYAKMTTEARAIVTVRGYGFCPDVIFGPLPLSPVPPVENGVREPDCKLPLYRCVGAMAVSYSI